MKIFDAKDPFGGIAFVEFKGDRLGLFRLKEAVFDLLLVLFISTLVITIRVVIPTFLRTDSCKYFFVTL